MSEIVVDVCCETCPVPLVQTRKAIMRAAPGDVITIVGTHSSSKNEIPMAVEALGLELLSIEEGGEGGEWTIRIRR